MNRYDRPGGYGSGRRDSHGLRNGVVFTAMLLVMGLLFVNTPIGASVLERIGLTSGQSAQTPNVPDSRSTAVAQDPNATPGRSAQAPGEGTPTLATPRPGETRTPSEPPPGATPSVDAVTTANQYFQNWRAGRYAEMHKLLSAASAQQYDAEYFTTRYEQIRDVATIQSVEPRLAPEAAAAARGAGPLVRLPFSVTITTTLVGDVQENNLLTLVQESGAWRVQWTPSLIFKDLSGDNRIRAVAEPATRGAIFDRKGKALAVDGELTQLGIVPGDIANEQNLLAQVSKAVGQTPQEIKAKYKGKNPAWLIPIADLPRDQAERIQQELADSPGVSFTKRTAREYPQRAVLAQILGYVGPIYAEDLNKPEYKGYSPNDVVGKTGLEAWGEKYLRGRPGGKLFIATPDEVEVKVIKETPYAPGNNIYLNIDLDLQVAVEQEMKGRKGSVVSLNPNNGEILTLASQPSYDLNQFVTGISQKDWERLNSEAAGYPLINRATASSFPMASTFKPITLGAALSAPLDNLDRTWYDTGAWDKDGTKRGDWKPGGHGYITLLDGLIQSCDIVFYDLGWELYQRDYDYLSTFTRQWLLGQKYGVEGVVEASGRVPGPGDPYPGWSPGDNVNLAIGQGALQVSPLQAANIYATIANGGTIYKPNLINRIVSGEDGGKVIAAFAPKLLGKAPVSPETMATLQRGLKGVTTDAMGTAYDTFKDSPIPVAGKTGTGQQDNKDPYAWFTAYAPADRPELAVAAVFEDAGQGSVIAAPVVRQVIEAYLQPPGQRP